MLQCLGGDGVFGVGVRCFFFSGDCAVADVFDVVVDAELTDMALSSE